MPRREIAVFFHRGHNMTSVRGVAAGIRDFVRDRDDLQFRYFNSSPSGLEALEAFSIRGAIAIGLGGLDLCLLERLEQFSIPVVHAGEMHGPRQFHEVRLPNVAIGVTGARHLIDTGLQHFAFVGEPLPHSVNRCKGFVQAASEAGYAPVLKLLDYPTKADRIEAFLRSLPLPVGLMANNDEIGWFISSEATRIGIRVPDEMALVGVGDDEPWCTLPTPPLTSIDPCGQEIGRKAMAMLVDLMDGRSTPLTVDIESTHVIERQSSAVVHTAHPEVSAAIRLIRQRYATPLTVHGVAESVGISVSLLERATKEALGRTPLNEIFRLRIESAKNLLAQTNLSVKAVARRCGFTNTKHLSVTFRAWTGTVPSQYRRQRSSNKVADSTPDN